MRNKKYKSDFTLPLFFVNNKNKNKKNTKFEKIGFPY